jgi:hypothetical protein
MSDYRKLTQQELLDEAARLFGPDPMTYAFRCPNCGDVATIKEFVEAGDGERAGKECIGRLLGALTKPAGRGGENQNGRGCDWAAYGLISGPWFVVMPAESDKPEREVACFPLAAPSAGRE